jgi:HK97 family phage portal protein|tara:strand:- start:34284 stop:36638 length:2355 start_codon:yes stop_codon:yes gene_type:complete
MQTPLSARFNAAAKAFVGIFSDNAARQAHGLLSGVLSGQGDPPYRGATNILDAYSTMPWLRSVSQRIATSVATSATQWKLYAPKSKRKRDARVIQRTAGTVERQALITKAADDVVEIESHILLDALNQANSYMVGQSLFKVTQIHLDLLGEAFWIKERNSFGAPVEFWPVPPDWVQETPTPDNRNFRVSFKGWQGEIPDTEVLWMADLNPANPYGRGTGLARSLSDELETDEYAAKHTRQLFFNRARPDMIIWPKQQGAHDIGLQQDQVRRLEERWLDGHQGFWRAFKPFFVGREIEVHEVNQSLRDLQLVELRQFERDMIVQVFGIPPELLGILSNSNRATIDSADYLFSRWAILPRLEFLRSQLQERLVPEYDDRLILDYVSPVQEDRAYMLDAAKAAPWAMKVDEWRVLQGQEPLGDNHGQVHLVPTTLVPVESPRTPPAPVPATGGDVIPANVEELSLQDHLQVFKDACDTEAVDIVLRELATNRSELIDIWKRLDEEEPVVMKRVRKHINELSNRVTLEDLNGLTNGPDLERLIRLDEWLNEFNDLMFETWRSSWMLGARYGAEDIDIELVRSAANLIKEDGQSYEFNVVNPIAVNWAKIHGAEFVQEIGLATKQAIRNSVSVAMVEGLASEVEAAELLKIKIGLTDKQQQAVHNYNVRLKSSRPDLNYAERMKRVKRYQKSKVALRAMTIARTELAFASAAGQRGLWEKAAKDGLIKLNMMKKKWIGTFDKRQCAICKTLSKSPPIAYEKTWPVGINTYADAPAHPNCRCRTSLVRAK